MAMNGRQKAMTGLLMASERRNMFDTSPRIDPLNGVDPLEALKLIVAECEKGSLAIKNLSMETFRNPRTFDTMGSDYQSIVPGDCFATLQMEIAPSGRVRDDYVSGRPAVNVTVNGVNVGMTREQYEAVAREVEGESLGGGVVFNEYGDIVEDNRDDLPSPSREADRAQDKREAKAARKAAKAAPPKPVTPTGASAAREVIFDDDGRDPT